MDLSRYRLVRCALLSSLHSLLYVLMMAVSRTVFLVLGLLAVALAGREAERFRDCSPKNSKIHVTYANILEPRVILGLPVQLEMEGYVDAGVDLTQYTLKLVAKRYAKNAWVEEASIGPILVRRFCSSPLRDSWTARPFASYLVLSFLRSSSASSAEPSVASV